MEFKEIVWNMGLALDEANKAFKKDEVPVGALVIDKNGRVIGKGHNLKERNHDACAHAEIIAMREAAKFLGDWRLIDCQLYVTLEPCPMCLNAMTQFRINRCIFGAYDDKGGALSLNYHFFKDFRLNHQFSIMGGVRHYECSKILSSFFKQKRKLYKK